jgi:arylsulfatase A-like enzyme
MGHPHVQTPNLDRLAGAGLLYERGYVTAPLCRPSLASIVTGLYPHQTRVRNNDPMMPKGTSRKKNPDVWRQMRARMEAPMLEHPSFVRILTENGYATLQTGKWWEGNPLNHGFTDAMTHGDPSRGGRHGDEGLKIGRETMQPIYDFVEKAEKNGQPFFVWYGVYLPHFPHNAPQRLFDKYKDIAPNEPTAWYWANVEWLDEGCGQLVDYLKEKNLYENTIFVYTCDNGWVPDPKRRNRFIRSKMGPYEAGIRTPMFITHEGEIESRRDTETLASNIDIAPTILHACGIEPPKTMSGLDLRDPAALEKRKRIFVDLYEHNGNLDRLDDLDDGLMARVVVDGWDKLIALADGGERYYDLKSDPDDRNDLAPENTEKVEQLSDMIDAWMKATPMMRRK